MPVQGLKIVGMQITIEIKNVFIGFFDEVIISEPIL
jgi:hypothetical protein